MAEKSHWLYDAFGHVKRAPRRDGLRKDGARKSNGKAQGRTWSRDGELHQTRIYEYVLSSAIHFTRHSSLMRHAKGRPPADCATHSLSGFIQACVATTAYVACLTRPGVPPEEREELTAHHGDFPFFRQSAIDLLGIDAVYIVEGYAKGHLLESGTITVPDFLSDEFTGHIRKQFKLSEEDIPNRPVRVYTFPFPRRTMNYLAKTYRVRHGSLAEFLTRAVMHLAYQTRLREKQLLANPQASAKILLNEAAQKDIDYRDLV